MKKIIFIFCFAISLVSCNLFNNKEKEAIEICQKAKTQEYGLETTWLDYANMIAKNDPNKKYDWRARITDDNKLYVVDFIDTSGFGYHWEVNIEQKIVRNINENEYLIRKYKLAPFWPDVINDFEITKIEQSGLRINKSSSYFNEDNSSGIVYMITAEVLNKTNKNITNADIGGVLKLIFKDTTVEGEGDYESGFKTSISESNPWEPNTLRKFYIKTKGINKIYLNYTPEYVVFDILLKAEDPTGYLFQKAIADTDLKKDWEILEIKSKNNSSNEEEEKLNSRETENQINNYRVDTTKMDRSSNE
jgi:hypothetical protein